jgi:hypothetical protein
MSSSRADLKEWKCPVCHIVVGALDDKSLLIAVTYHMLEHLGEVGGRDEEEGLEENT